MEIVIATIADVDELTNVEVESKLRSFTDNEPVAIDYDTRYYRWNTYFNGQSPASAKQQRVVYKAIIDGKIVGYIAGHLTTRYEKDAEIQSFYILKEYQRKGIGAKLLTEFLGWLQTQRATSLCVGIDSTNPYQAFYLKQDAGYLNPHWMFWDDIEALQRKITQD
ncbi:GNAT family N-acetyltransferase [Mucilaginibacter sp.]|uniref:GNAT family N-acetyltransferase n=1 Tax=Mucilaginibacter sp. TaxID=1882438 RepID=UPI0025FADB81|nr:GNAT family N-acetyltransferase [Mucilaginibacter sp.]